MREAQYYKQNYRAKEAAEYLGIALSTIWLYAKQGRLTPIKLSPRITIFKKEELDNLGATA
ncbi:hypothetical protein TSL6_10530 [Sulfurovum sp. TSL6]|uniref:helix-turn-helix transcriptional regulator n=1 Tax=Sulfurovum sp. TSL6 TaxID=2826995 RepID=UPI001CC4D3F5|nr:helix-turn-helix domain-containing protein [Sulfurovum sp. TSL6]GIU00547.1 hypothetical protein TSL6_10530 [Sulfurovum sp. TSL6]